MMLELDGLTHRYGDEPAVDDVSFGVESGELVALLGPSGCGKTTVVQAIAGHVRPTAGRVVLRGETVTDEPPESRRAGLVFQRPTLYPHMTVRENVAYGLKARGVGRNERAERVAEHLDLVSLGDQRDAYPSELSGGQQRRVELARALAPRPDVLLLDEPLSALDRTLRERLRDEIARVQRETGVTTLFVTHDQEEAMALADRIVVMNDGTVSAVGQPRTLYESPPTPFVASFLGRSNAFSATVRTTRPLTLGLDEETITLADAATSVPEGTDLVCHIRPEAVSVIDEETTDRPVTLSGEVTRVADLGRRYDVAVRIGTSDTLVVERTRDPPAVGQSVTVGLDGRQLTMFAEENGERLDTHPDRSKGELNAGDSVRWE